MRDLLRLAGLLVPQWRRVLLGTALALATVLANIGLLALSSWFIASMAIAGSLGAAMDYTLPAVGVRALAIIRAAGRYAERLANHDTTFRILSSLRLWFYERLEPLAPARLAAFRSGDLLARIRADIDTLDDYYVRGIVPAFAALLAGACILPFLSRYDPRLAWIDCLGLVFAGLAAPLALSALAARPGRESLLGSAELRASLVEEIEGMADLIALGAVAAHARRMDETAARLDRSQGRLASLRGVSEAAVVAASSLTVWGSAFVLVAIVGSGGLPRADMAMLTVFVLASFETILPLPTAIQKAGEMASAAERLFEILDAEPAVPQCSSRPPASPGRSADLFVRDLRFRYASDLPPVFDGFSLDLPAGARLGLAGPSGAGKSSLVSLLLRFWDYQDGSIELAGRDLRSSSRPKRRGDSSRSSPKLPSFTTHRSATTSSSRQGPREAIPAPTRRRAFSRPSRRRNSPSFYPSCPRASTRSSARREGPFRAASCSASPSRGLSSRMRPSIFWTNRRRVSTTAAPMPCWKPWSGASTEGRSSSSATASAIWRSPIACFGSVIAISPYGFSVGLRAIICIPAIAGRARGGASCTSRSIRKSASRRWKRT